MSKDLSFSSDLSWLTKSPILPSIAHIMSAPKPSDIQEVCNIEPWESLTNVSQVRRNLNKSNWTPKPAIGRESTPATSFQENPNSRCNYINPDSALSHQRDPLCESYKINIENNLPHSWSYYDQSLQNSSRDAKPVSAFNQFFNSPLDFCESPAKAENFSGFHSRSSPNLPSVNFEALNCELFRPMTTEASSLREHFHREKKNQEQLANMPLTPIDSLSPSTTSGSSPKLNNNLISLMRELALITNEEDGKRGNNPSSSLSPFQTPPHTPTSSLAKGCVFCKNNSYHSTFYKSHVLKDDNGHCSCPVLRTYICPLCGESGDFAHTLKYCPRNSVTKGDPIAAGLPPGKVTNWREVATKMSSQYKH